MVKEKRINNLIFDKRLLTIFHQPSVEWYFTKWKPEMLELGLKHLKKILPDDQLFVSVVAGWKGKNIKRAF